MMCMADYLEIFQYGCLANECSEDRFRTKTAHPTVQGVSQSKIEGGGGGGIRGSHQYTTP